MFYIIYFDTSIERISTEKIENVVVKTTLYT